MTGLHRRQFF